IMVTLEEFDGLLTRSGVSLASLGIRDIALSRSNALKAVELLRRAKFPILGGDVYFRRGDRIEVAYANWYADPEPSEDHDTYLRRRWDKAETYLKNFPETTDAEVLFALVVKS
ncbi:MAG: Imm40 family immunity protein, partial [Acetobacteraceae bacterium]